MPSMSGMKDAAIDYALGLGGGILYALSSAFTGSGLLGGIIGAVLAGSIIKGERGTVIATMLGFQTIVGAASNASASNTSSPSVM